MMNVQGPILGEWLFHLSIVGFFLPVVYWTYKYLEERKPSTPSRPEVTLRFVYPKAPAIELINQSDVVAREIKWSVALWNLDTLSERTDPLPIPIKTFDWIRPNQRSGPLGVFTAQTVKPLLTPGNRLVGSVSVSCPDCVRGWTYMVYIKWGDGGWYSEVKDEVSGDLLVPKKFTAEVVLAFFEDCINNVPEKNRILITER